MGFLSKFEGKMEDTFEGAADKLAGSPLSPVQIAKKAEKQMRRNKMVGAGKQYAPTLYTVLVNADDDERLFGYYPTLAGETETYLAAKAAEDGLVMDGQPLVRFIVDEGLRHGKFDVVAEPVAAPLIAQLRAEEMQRYGLAGAGAAGAGAPAPGRAPAPAPNAGYDDYGYQDDYGYGYDEYGAAPAPAPGAPAPADAQDAPFAGLDAYEDPELYGAPLDPAAPYDPAPAPVPGPAPAPAPQADRTMVFSDAAPAPGAPAAQRPAPAHLEDLTNHRTYPLTQACVVLGRESACDISLPDINASRRHAELRFEQPGVWVLSDLGSTNGTFVNGREISTVSLRGGEAIVLGMTNLRFVLG